MKPYKHIETHHLGFLLFIARLFAVVAFLVFGLVLVVLLDVAFIESISYSSATIFGALIITLGLLGFSGVFAAIVAFEEGFRKRTEALLHQTKI